MPKTVPGTYYEPFLGGGAVYFSSATRFPKSVLADFNPDLMCAYQQVRDNLPSLMAGLLAVAKDFDEQAFYKLRAAAPDTDLDRAVRFIAYNRTCFNGLFRVNSSGGWNTPYGHLKNPTICNKPLLTVDSTCLTTAVLKTGSFEITAGPAAYKDFIYLDPPYIPTSLTASFSKYSAGDFGINDQKALARFIAERSDAGALVMLSNSDTELSREVFAPVLPLYQVSVHRSIAASAASRGEVSELLATNIPVADMADGTKFLEYATRL